MLTAGNVLMKNHATLLEESEDSSYVCPLCQHDEYLISQDEERFICGSCGFKTHQFQTIQAHLISTNYLLTPSSRPIFH